MDGKKIFHCPRSTSPPMSLRPAEVVSAHQSVMDSSLDTMDSLLDEATAEAEEDEV